MHQYLKAIGFENIQTRKDLKKLLKEVEENFTHQTIVSYRPGEDFCEFQKEFGQDVGITLCGELDDKEHFEAAYYFPYFEGSGVTTYAEIDVQRKIEKEQYVGLCEDSKIGISLIFTLQNGVEYMREKQAGLAKDMQTSVTFSGLAQGGMILLPVNKNEQQILNEKRASDTRRELMNAARKGDQAAIETLTFDDMDLYSKILFRLTDKRIKALCACIHMKDRQFLSVLRHNIRCSLLLLDSTSCHCQSQGKYPAKYLFFQSLPPFLSGPSILF